LSLNGTLPLSAGSSSGVKITTPSPGVRGSPAGPQAGGSLGIATQ
jgi:hypothetical protein